MTPKPPDLPDTFDLSIVLVSWNTRDLLRDCLCSVRAALAASPAFHAEIWVVDNASSDGSAGMVRESFPEVLLLENTKNQGFARAANAALRRATGRCWLLLNPDTLVPAGALPALCDALVSREDAAVCGPLLENADGSPQFSWARFPGMVSEWTGHLDRSQCPYPLADFASPPARARMAPFTPDWVGGACFLIRARAARQVGLLDEGFFFSGEETEWCHRLRRRLGDAGGRTLLIPSITVTHLGGQSSRHAAPRVTRRQRCQSAVRLYRKQYGALSPAAWAAGALALARLALSPLRVQGRAR
ncbi:MAG: glycosyltransferase family 2 protein [Cytophagales bacterium]|nr:glycosyltransferase family 2 protein [Armatimonadota bacterium]